MDEAHEIALFERIEEIEKKVDRYETTNKVALAVGTAFMAIILLIAQWYLSGLDADMTELRKAQQEAQSTLARLETAMGFYQASFGTHIGDPSNHPDNTERVNRVIDDVRELRVEIDRHH